MESYKEIESMKQQIALLKQKLDNENMINERLVHVIIKDKVKKLMKDKYICIVGVLFGLPYCTWSFSEIVNLSTAFIITTDVFFLIALAYTFYTYKGINTLDMTRNSLIQMGEKLIIMKKRNANWLKFGIPFLIIWFTWFLIENIHFGNPSAFYIGGSCGLVIGFALGMKLYMKRKRNTDEIIRQIEEFTTE